MADEPLYALVQGNRLHRYPAFEEDNLDDATVVQRNLTEADVDALEEESGPFERCERCFRMEG
jgi:hypothetical protein